MYEVLIEWLMSVLGAIGNFWIDKTSKNIWKNVKEMEIIQETTMETLNNMYWNLQDVDRFSNFQSYLYTEYSLDNI